MEQWEQNYYISSIAGATNGSSLVVMSKGLLEHVSLALVSLNFSYIINKSHLRLHSLRLVLSGTPYTQQSYKVSESFPFKWINKKWKEGFHVTSMTTAGNRWGVVMSRNSGYSEQVKFDYVI